MTETKDSKHLLEFVYLFLYLRLHVEKPLQNELLLKRFVKNI